MQFTILAEGLRLPEGPIALPDGSIIVTEVLGGCLTRIWGDNRTEVVAMTGGGPNGLALGPDGALYVCNNGGYRLKEDPNDKNAHVIDAITPPDSHPGACIQRVDLDTGKVEILYDRAGDQKLRAPNDLAFDRQGGLWFTDFGRSHIDSRDRSGIYYAPPDGSGPIRKVYGAFSFNGIGLSADETVLYSAETFSGKLWAFDLDAPGQLRERRDRASGGRVKYALQNESMFDSLALDESGAVCIGMLGDGIGDGGIAVVSPDGSHRHIALPDATVTNICFGGPDRMDAFVTLGHTGKLIKMRWPVPGLAMNFTEY